MARRKQTVVSRRFIPGVTERSDPQPSTARLISGPMPVPSPKQRLIDAQLAGERAGRGAAQAAFSLDPGDKDFETILNVGDAIDTACQVAQRIARREIEKRVVRYDDPGEHKAFLAGAQWSVDQCLQGICDSDRTAPCVEDEEGPLGPLDGLGCGCGRRR